MKKLRELASDELASLIGYLIIATYYVIFDVIWGKICRIPQQTSEDCQPRP